MPENLAGSGALSKTMLAPWKLLEKLQQAKHFVAGAVRSRGQSSLRGAFKGREFRVFHPPEHGGRMQWPWSLPRSVRRGLLQAAGRGPRPRAMKARTCRLLVASVRARVAALRGEGPGPAREIASIAATFRVDPTWLARQLRRGAAS